MGAWGPGIFSNDLAADARAEWRDALIAGEDPPDASARIVSEYSAALDETEFWTGLAAAQHETGHLQPAVRDRALAIIEAGGDIEDWEESGSGGARARALARLADKLRGPQPRPKRLRGPRPGPDPGVEIGDVLLVRHGESRRWALFCVVAIEQDHGSRHPTVLGLFTDDVADVPTASEIAKLPYLSAVDIRGAHDDLPSSALVDEPMVWSCAVYRSGDEFGAHIGEIIARGVTPAGIDKPLKPGAYTYGLRALVEFVGSPALDLCREATRRRLDGRGEAARREFEKRRPEAVALLKQDLLEDAAELPPGLPAREAKLLMQIRQAAEDMLREIDADTAAGDET